MQNKEIYSTLVKALSLAVKCGDKKLMSEIRSLVIKNFKGSDVLNEVRAICEGLQPVSSSESANLKISKLSADDFLKDKKKEAQKEVNIHIAADEEDEKMFTVANTYKHLLELTNDELKEKFGEAGIAVDFLNKVRSELGLNDVNYKTWSPLFIKTFRDTLALKIQQ